MKEYITRNQVDSELAFIRMDIKLEGAAATENRFVVMTKKNADGTRNYMVRLIRPKEVEGVTVLVLEKPSALQQFVFLPDVGKSTRVSGSGQAGPFLGSDFSYEDLVHEIPRNFKYTRLADAKVSGETCFVIRATAADGNLSSGYLHRDLFLDQKDYRLMKIDFYNPAGRLMKNLTATEYQSAKVQGETLRPRSALMTNVEKKSTTTFLVVESRLNLALDDELFTTKKVETWTPQEIESLIFDLGIISVKATP